MSLLDSGFLQKLDMLRLMVQGRFSGFRQALHRSKKVGVGVSFADHREYMVGDDLRYVDWAMYARSEKLLLKRFEEEEDIPVYVMLDASESMRWKEESSINSKYDHACQIALALLYIALSELNTTFLYLNTDSVIAEKSKARGKEQIFSFAQFLEAEPKQTKAKTHLAQSLTELLHKTKKPGLLIVLSDFYDESPYETRLQALAKQGFEPMLIQLFDPKEADLLLEQEWQLEDIETEERFSFLVSQQSKDHYRQQQLVLSEKLRLLGSSLGGSYLQADMTQPFEQFMFSQLFFVKQ